MSGSVPDELQQALALTTEMSAAAADGNWGLVVELDTRRQLHLQRMQGGSLDSRHAGALAALQAQNETLLERVRELRAAVEDQLSQHLYKHRALQAYVSAG